MICPGPDEDSYKVCIECKACYPGLSPRTQEILEICADPNINLRDEFTKIIEEVMA